MGAKSSSCPGVPRIVWPDEEDDVERGSSTISSTTTITDPIRLLEEIQSRYPNEYPQFYPRVSSAVDASRCDILRLPGVMPRNTDSWTMSSAPYIFRSRDDDDDGEDGLSLVNRSSIAVTLEEIEEMQEEYDMGPFLLREGDVPHDDADEALREVVRLLLDWRMNVGISPERTEDGVVPVCCTYMLPRGVNNQWFVRTTRLYLV